MTLPIHAPLLPMEARLVRSLPDGEEYQYEPKWDGFRCLVFKDGTHVELQSKAGQPLARYFPEVVDRIRRIKATRFVLDGELVVPVGGALDFDALLQRVHPAESRVQKLARETPALFIAFDLLVDTRGRSLVEHPLAERRTALEAFAHAHLDGVTGMWLSPATRDRKEAAGWLKGASGTDGVMAKLLDAPYASGERTAMDKVKRVKTADCVVGGFRDREDDDVVGSLLLGLYDEKGLLHHVGFTSSIKAADRAALTKRLEKLVREPGFTGRKPGGPSRWTTRRSSEWQPLAPKLVVEVGYDHFSGGRFRHGTKLLRFRPDKAPTQCRLTQVGKEAAAMELLVA